MRLYTDIDPFCCAVLRERVADGGLLPGDVLEADIRTLTAEMLAPYSQVHLFAGIGGSPLGLLWAGWPDEWPIVTLGFPCQDISAAGKGDGLDGERSGLFWEGIRVIGIKRPLGILGENVGALSTRGLDRVVGALGESGYDCAALRLGAWAVGAPHERERWWIVAVLRGVGRGSGCGVASDETVAGLGRDQSEGGDQEGELADAGRGGRRIDQPGRGSGRGVAAGRASAEGEPVVHAERGGEQERSRASRRPRGQRTPERAGPAEPGEACVMADAERPGLEGHRPDAGQPQEPELRYASPRRWPAPYLNGPSPQYDWEPPRLYSRGMAGLADGIPARLASYLNKCGVAATGNAQVPQCVEVIARGLMHAIETGVSA